VKRPRVVTHPVFPPELAAQCAAVGEPGGLVIAATASSEMAAKIREAHSLPPHSVDGGVAFAVPDPALAFLIVRHVARLVPADFDPGLLAPPPASHVLLFAWSADELSITRVRRAVGCA
jgi:hypothetical protein